VARNRKRAKERRARRPQPVVGGGGLSGGEDAADPLAHAAPDVELAEAQLALGRPELAESSPEEEEFNEEELEAEAEVGAEEPYETGNGGGGDGGGGGLVAVGGPGGEGGAHLPSARPHIGGRLIGFLQGSWRELQRVQWPDRRQVMQATGVVIGFVIVAGIFLGVSDYLAGKLMDYILK
jgi:preprotein translocase subunit SecE